MHTCCQPSILFYSNGLRNETNGGTLLDWVFQSHSWSDCHFVVACNLRPKWKVGYLYANASASAIDSLSRTLQDRKKFNDNWEIRDYFLGNIDVHDVLYKYKTTAITFELETIHLRLNMKLFLKYCVRILLRSRSKIFNALIV